MQQVCLYYFHPLCCPLSPSCEIFLSKMGHSVLMWQNNERIIRATKHLMMGHLLLLLFVLFYCILQWNKWDFNCFFFVFFTVGHPNFKQFCLMWGGLLLKKSILPRASMKTGIRFQRIYTQALACFRSSLTRKDRPVNTKILNKYILPEPSFSNATLWVM